MFSEKLNLQATLQSTKSYYKPLSEAVCCTKLIEYRANRPHTVYQLYNAAGEVIYVGLTINITNRLHQHKRKPWAAEIVDYSYKNFTTRTEAAAMERHLVHTTQAKYNQMFRVPAKVEMEAEVSPELAEIHFQILNFKVTKLPKHDNGISFMTDSCLEQLQAYKVLNDWEVGFYRSLVNFKTLSHKQVDIFCVISGKVHSLVEAIATHPKATIRRLAKHSCTNPITTTQP